MFVNVWWWLAVGAGVAAISVLVLALVAGRRARTCSLRGRHALVTGGSSGIGLAAAREAARRGAHVTLVGRDPARLAAAAVEVSSCAHDPDQAVRVLSLDLAGPPAALQAALATAEADLGPIYLLVNCAGACVCGRFEDTALEDERAMLDLNYLGSAIPTRYVLPGMKRRGEGRIVLVSTQAALLGIYGYSAYSASKWAVRGLGESLMMELVGTGVHLTLSFPPDTDTPGFAAENATKPIETKLISGSGGLISPDVVGKQLVEDVLAGKAYSVVGLSGRLMSLLFCGSIDSASQVVMQVLSMGVLRVVIVACIMSFHQIIRREMKNRRETEKEQKTEDTKSQ